jgi:archaellum biogenesis ATPase FlaH
MAVEREFLKKALFSTSELSLAAEKQVESDLILDPINKKLFEIVSWYFQKYSAVPTTDTLKMILSKSKIAEDVKQKVLLLFTELAAATYPDRPLTFLIDELKQDFKSFKLRDTLITSVNHLEADKINDSINSLKEGISKLELVGRDDVREGYLDKSADDRFAHYTDIKTNPDKYKGIPIGWPTFDSITNGVRGGQLMVIIAAVKEGKSTALMNIGYSCHAAGYNVLYVSVEMPKEQVERRYDSRASGLEYSKIRDGKLNPMEEEIYKQCLNIQKSRTNKFYVIDAHDCNTTLIRSKLKTFPQKFDLVIVDYLTIVKPEVKATSGRDQWESIGKVTEEIRAIARELNIPIITAAQANRDGIKEAKYKYNVENIGLSHLISAHADTLLSLRLTDRDELEVSDVVEMTAATIAIRDDKGCRFTIDACFGKMLMAERFVSPTVGGLPLNPGALAYAKGESFTGTGGTP